MAANHVQTVNFNVPLMQILNILRHPSFCAAHELNVQYEMPFGNGVQVQYHHGVSWTSWGEDITITLSAASPTMTTLSIGSECSLPTQIVDWGKNRGNVDGILADISANVARMSAPIAAASVTPPPPPTNNDVKFCSRCGSCMAKTAGFCAACGARV